MTAQVERDALDIVDERLDDGIKASAVKTIGVRKKNTRSECTRIGDVVISAELHVVGRTDPKFEDLHAIALWQVGALP